MDDEINLYQNEITLMTEELEKCDSQLLMAQQEMRRLDFDWHDT